jgi:DNA-binding XRE family transcriptional regulator
VLNLERKDGVKNMALQAARLEAQITQAEAAKKARIAERLYQYYEYDRYEPGVRTAIRIARALNKSVGDMAELFPERTPDCEKGEKP